MITREEFNDALAELVNVGVGRAASSLSTMVSARIDLSVPKVVTIPHADIGLHLNLEHEIGLRDEVVVVQQAFTGKVGGAASILFPVESARNLVGLLTGGLLSNEELDLEREAALTEVGNILINGVMGTIGNIIGVEIRYHLPEYVECHADELPQVFQQRDLMLAVVLIAISGQEIKGHLVLLFDIPSMDSLAAIIEEMTRGSN
ncbi:MAG: CheC, inhibitor of methylation [Holophagaceae bacterium]|nr:CheC, inhibitor of methylation [Holophagaceae bacterium]